MPVEHDSRLAKLVPNTIEADVESLDELLRQAEFGGRFGLDQAAL